MRAGISGGTSASGTEEASEACPPPGVVTDAAAAGLYPLRSFAGESPSTR
ncbi:hypothetical protein ACFTAO_06140 [Paenibacillus rhizoplanae]